MSGFDDIQEVLHRIPIYLYPNMLPGSPQDDFIARIDDEATLTLEDVCASMKKRGGYEGNVEKLASDIKQFYEEMIYQLCNGFSIENDYYSIRLSIGGTWNSDTERFDPKKHPISITFRPRKELHSALQRIAIENKGFAQTNSFIHEVIDAQTKLVNASLSPNEDFIISGSHIKITKDEAGCGLFLVGPLANGLGPEIEIPKYTENTASKVIARAPASLAAGQYKFLIKTKYSGGNLLKTVRLIETPFTLTVS